MKTVAPVSANSVGGSRWCQTPEQVMLLEGMYRGGLKTPTATQIQQVTARLSVYGRIQGKNVFYWFQNHKARDRQKMQRKLLAMHQHQCLYPPYNNSSYHHNNYPFAVQGGAGVVQHKSSCRNMFGEGNVDQTSSKVMCDCSLMIITTMESTSPCCIRIQPKTLQLFPTTPSQPK